MLTMPAQFGPTTLIPYWRATHRISSSPAGFPASEKPEEITTTACSPAWPQSCSTAGTVAAGRLRVLYNSNVQRIEAGQVFIEQEGQAIELANDALIVLAGGVLPTPFLKQIGIHVETKFGTA